MNDDTVKKVLLIIADISGYTKLMVSTELELEHSQRIISQLIQSIIKQIEIPLEVSKLEGDAVFLYSVKDRDTHMYEDVKKKIGKKLMQFFNVFHSKLDEIIEANTCPCGACSNVDALRLKMVAHSGEAYFYQINQFNELSGKDVILIHRLLKNSVFSNEYILMTDQAYSDIEFPQLIDVQEGVEHYEHLGKIKTLTYFHRH